MKPYLLIHASDVARSLEWYGRLGFYLRRVGRHGGWAELEWGDTLLFLHPAPTPRPAGFAMPGFEVTEPLETVAGRLSDAGLLSEINILDEGFGRTLTLTDPDGYEWQLLEHEPELYA